MLNDEQKQAVEHEYGPCFVSACPGSGKCIVGDSIVVLNDGFSEISNDKVEWIRAFDSESLNRSKYQSIRVTNFVDSGIKPTLCIGTEEGYGIQGTYHHPIAILNNKCELEWKKIEDIQIGDVAVLQMEKAHDNPMIGYAGVYDIWYAIGLLLGDGYLSRKNELSITTNDDEIECSFASIFKHYYNYEVKKYYDKRRVGLRTLGVFSKDIKNDIRQKFGNIYHLACDKKLTPEILTGNRGEIGSLLQGLFDTDGYVSGANVEICLCSRKLVEQIQIIMLRFGVFSSYAIKEVDGSIYHRLHISGENMRRFEKNIGFRLNRKKEQLQNIACKKSNPNKTIPYAQYLVTKIYNEVKAKQPDNYDPKTSYFYDATGGFVRLIRYCSKSGTVLRGLTETAAYRLISACELAGIESEALEQLKFLVDNFGFSKVTEIFDGGEQHVYDYFIEGSHNFIANGFVNHNTRIIVERTVRLIEKGHTPRRILCITFTNKAASEMKERLAKRIGDKAQEIYISTFHALCATILRKYGSYLGYSKNTTIIDDEEQEGLLLQCSRQLGLEYTKPELRKILGVINNLREQLLSDEDILNDIHDKNHSKIASEYIERLRKNKQTDFSGLLSETYRLLQADSSVLSILQQRFDFIQIDETQDTNYAQFTIMNMIGAHGNVLIVGDSDQGIYSWRGARYENISDFVRDKKAKVIELYQNYRSTPEIVKVAASLVAKNPNRQQKIEFKTCNESGSPVEVYALPNTELEGKYIGLLIEELIHKKNYKPSDIAVLYRLNSMSRAIEQGLIERQIPYEVFGGLSFYDRAEIKDSISMLRFFINPNDGLAMGRFINKPACKIGEATIGAIENYARAHNINLMEALHNIEKIDIGGANKQEIYARCRKIVDAFDNSNFATQSNIGTILEKILIDIDYDSYLSTKYEEKEYQDRKGNLEELIKSCSLYSESHAHDIGAYLTNIALQTSTDKKAEDDCVSLMSIHASKGLEFPVVFMPCLEENCLPFERALKERNGIEEERRLCYVGMTRAEKHLVLTYADKRLVRYGAHVMYKKTKPSRFLTESGVIKNVKIIK